MALIKDLEKEATELAEENARLQKKVEESQAPVSPEDLVRLENYYKGILEKTKKEVEAARTTHANVTTTLNSIDLSKALNSIVDVQKTIQQ